MRRASHSNTGKSAGLAGFVAWHLATRTIVILVFQDSHAFLAGGCAPSWRSRLVTVRRSSAFVFRTGTVLGVAAESRAIERESELLTLFGRTLGRCFDDRLVHDFLTCAGFLAKRFESAFEGGAVERLGFERRASRSACFTDRAAFVSELVAVLAIEPAQRRSPAIAFAVHRRLVAVGQRAAMERTPDQDPRKEKVQTRSRWRARSKGVWRAASWFVFEFGKGTDGERDGLFLVR